MFAGKGCEADETCDSGMGEVRTELLVEGWGSSADLERGEGEFTVSDGEGAADNGGDGPAGPKRASLFV